MSTFNGVIEKLYVKFNDKAKRNSISIINSGNFYGLGLHDEKIVKVGDIVLKEGMEVSFTYDDGKYKNVVLDTLKIIKTQPSKETAKAMKDNDLPVRLGNALNVATNFTKTHIDSVALAKQILPLIDDLRDKLTEKYPEMNMKGLNARCGQCVLVAAQFTKNQDTFIEVAEQLFDELCLAEEELKNPVVKDVKEVQQTIIEDNNGDWDDIPFAPIGLQHPQILWCI